MKYCTKKIQPYFHSHTNSFNRVNFKQQKKQIFVQNTTGNIVFDHQIKTLDGWVAGIKFLQETDLERAQMVKSSSQPQHKDIIILHAELGHPSKATTEVISRTMGLNLTGTFKLCGDCALEKDKKSGAGKKAVEYSKILRERLFFDISSPSTPTFGGMNHWLLAKEDSSDFVCFHY